MKCNIGRRYATRGQLRVYVEEKRERRAERELVCTAFFFLCKRRRHRACCKRTSKRSDELTHGEGYEKQADAKHGRSTCPAGAVSVCIYGRVLAPLDDRMMTEGLRCSEVGVDQNVAT